MSAALTRPPLATCMRVNTLRVNTDEVLRKLPGAVTPEDGALLQERPPYVHPLVR